MKIYSFLRFPSLKNRNFSDTVFYPSISYIIAAYNEEEVIAEKIENTLALQYPGDKIEILVFSDGSTDMTEEIVNGYSDRGVKLHTIHGRLGKTECQNRVAQKAKGEILIFSDANSEYDKNAILKLVRHFQNKSVGCVCGRLVYKNNRDKKGHAAGFFERMFMNYSQTTKELEASVVAPVGANGAIYAMRRELFELVPSSYPEDYIRPLRIVKRGYKVVYEPEAICEEPSVNSFSSIWNKKSRIASQSLATLSSEKDILNPFKFGIFAIQVWTKSVLRRLGLLFGLVLFCSNVLLVLQYNVAMFYKIIFIIQLILWVWVLLTFTWIMLFKKGSYDFHNKLLTTFLFFPAYLFLINLSAFWGFIKFVISGDTRVTWEKAR